MTTIEWVIALTAVAVGACAQGSIGFGLGMVAAPVLVLTDPDFIPGPLLIVAFLLAVLVTTANRTGIDWFGLRWAVVGRIPGSVLGTAAVVVLPERELIILFAVLVLMGVGLSVAGLRVDPTKPALVSAGAMSGFMGSITSIGGPPMALVYQDSRGAEIRATISGFFIVGSALSIGLLAIAGEMGAVDLGRAAALTPAMLVGFGASRRLARLLDRGFMRPALLGFSAVTSAALLVIELV